MNFDDGNQMFKENPQKEADVAAEIQSAKGSSSGIISLLKLRAEQTGGKLSQSDFDKIIQTLGISNDKRRIEEILSIYERESMITAEEASKNIKGRPPKIVSTLKEKAKQNDGKLTWGDLDSILQSLGIENDTDAIDEILSICEREGIEITNEDNLLEDIDIPFDYIPLEEPENINFNDIDITFKYSRIDSGIRIDRYHGSAKKVTIPSQIDNLPVTSIGNRAFRDCKSLTEITIPDSVTSIGGDCNFGTFGAFSGCKSLREIKIPYSVTSIGFWAFYGCESLTEITIPDSVKSIGDGAFWGCESLTEITIPDSVKSIGSWAFYGCESLIEITISEGVTSIGDSAFRDCKILTKITIPPSVTTIRVSAFYDCKHLEIIYIDAATLSRESIKRSIDDICKQNSSCKILSIPKE